MSREVVANIIVLRPRRVVFVSCDPATLARDLKTFMEAGYELDGLTAFDLFPNTAHIESVAVLRSSA
jgi:tRNA/tmRNA/rRNA uracil-C5-methylase (TrmA/RlmC/RlmD family)